MRAHVEIGAKEWQILPRLQGVMVSGELSYTQKDTQAGDSVLGVSGEIAYCLCPWRRVARLASCVGNAVHKG